MPMYKCDEPGCEKYFNSHARVAQHKDRVHGKGESDGDTLTITKPSEETGGDTHHCNDCGATFPEGTDRCPGCGEQLAWPDEE